MALSLTLSPRLKAAAELVRPGARLADVGTDHAYVPVYLVKNGVCPSAIASDLKKGPLENAQETVLHYGVAPQVQLRRSDGLRRIRGEETDDVLIAGMGGQLIAEILGAAPWLRDPSKHLILQPMTHAEDLRRFLRSGAFTILREVVVQEERRLYLILEAQFTGYAPPRPEGWDYVGELHPEEPLHRAYLQKARRRWQKKYDGLLRAGALEEAERVKPILSYFPKEEEQ